MHQFLPIFGALFLYALLALQQFSFWEDRLSKSWIFQVYCRMLLEKEHPLIISNFSSDSGLWLKTESCARSNNTHNQRFTFCCWGQELLEKQILVADWECRENLIHLVKIGRAFLKLRFVPEVYMNHGAQSYKLQNKSGGGWNWELDSSELRLQFCKDGQSWDRR